MGALVRGGKTAIGVQAGLTLAGGVRAGPLRGGNRQSVVAQPSDVEVAPPGAFAVLVPQGLWGGKVQQPCVLRALQGHRQLLANVAGNLPVVPGLTGRGHCSANAADAAFAVGHRAFFFAPSGGR